MRTFIIKVEHVNFYSLNDIISFGKDKGKVLIEFPLRLNIKNELNTVKAFSSFLDYNCKFSICRLVFDERTRIGHTILIIALICSSKYHIACIQCYSYSSAMTSNKCISSPIPSVKLITICLIE